MSDTEHEEAVRRAIQALAYISRPTMGLQVGQNPVEAAFQNDEGLVRQGLAACIRTASKALADLRATGKCRHCGSGPDAWEPLP